MALDHDHTEELLRRAATGDDAAWGTLLARDCSRLTRMVANKMDPRLSRRVDPADVVQEMLIVAIRNRARYLDDPKLPPYPWLRRLTIERLRDLERWHLDAKKRSVFREQQLHDAPSDDAVRCLADHLLSSGTSPSRRLIRAELFEQVRAALHGLAPKDEELLLMRHYEQMSISEIAAVLQTNEDAIKMRLSRALQRFSRLFAERNQEDQP